MAIGFFFLFRGIYFFIRFFKTGLKEARNKAKAEIKEKIEHIKFKKNVDRELEEILNNEHRENSR